MPDADAPKSTIRDVADLAGVSAATASRALNGRGDVSVATRARVLQAARTLRFAPRAYRRAGSRETPRTVGLLTSDPGGRFSMAILSGAEDALGAGEIEVLLCAARHDPIRERHYLRTLDERAVEGIIVVGDSTNPRTPLPGHVEVPVVYAFAPSTDPTDVSLAPDDVQGGRVAAEHLLALGRERIAIIAGPVDWLSARERVAGARDALDSASVELGVEPLLGPDWTQRWGRAATSMLLRRQPDVDAIICGCDQIAVGVMDTLRQLGRNVPDEVSVVGFDNWLVFAEDANPRLTTIDMRLEALGREAARTLFRSIRGDVQAGTRRLPCQLVVRESTLSL